MQEAKQHLADQRNTPALYTTHAQINFTICNISPTNPGYQLGDGVNPACASRDGSFLDSCAGVEILLCSTYIIIKEGPQGGVGVTYYCR